MANNMAHIDLSREADALLVAPATADFLAKVAHGLADDLPSTLTLARSCPLLVAPAMNKQMWETRQRNAISPPCAATVLSCSAQRRANKPAAKAASAA